MASSSSNPAPATIKLPSAPAQPMPSSVSVVIKESGAPITRR